MASFLLFLQKSSFNMMLFSAFVVSGALLAWGLIGRLRSGGVRLLPAADAVQLINRRNAAVVDVRSAADFARGHIAGARHIPLAEVAARAGELPRDQALPVILACQWGNQAPQAAAALGKAGHAEVYVLRGGMSAWQEAGLPLEKK